MRILTCLLSGFALLALSVTTYATTDEDLHLNTLVYKVSDEAWVSIWTARVNVEYSANMDEQKLATMREEFTGKLAEIVEVGKWNVTRFQRSQDESGLEKIRVEANIRVPLNVLDGIRKKAKAISKPGAVFEVTSIEYTASLADEEKVREELREKIYAQARAELARVNKIFPGQTYFVHKVDFVPSNIPMQDRMMVKRAAQSSQSGSLVSEKITMSAVVQLSSAVDLSPEGLKDIAASKNMPNQQRVIVKQ